MSRRPKEPADGQARTFHDPRPRREPVAGVLRRAFGLEPADRFAFDGFTLLYLRHPTSPFELELTVNTDRTAPYELGDGYGHLAVVVDDLAAEHARFKREGLEAGDLKELKHGDATLARFFFATDPDGYKIEVIAKGGRFG